jgi:4'-phosphopantetheinyl transferase EntD
MPSTRFDRLLPAGVVVVEATPEMWAGSLYAEEEASIVRAVTKRRREFAAGRNCAREALMKLGFESMPIPVDIDRSPRFPSSVSGSITHTDTYCAAAVVVRGAVASIGIDAELRIPLSDETAPMILSDEELAAYACANADYDLRKLAFSAKEAFYKAYYQTARSWLSFRDAHVTFDMMCGVFDLVILGNADDRWLRRSFRGRYAMDDEHFYCAVALLSE